MRMKVALSAAVGAVLILAAAPTVASASSLNYYIEVTQAEWTSSSSPFQTRTWLAPCIPIHSPAPLHHSQYPPPKLI